MLKNGISYVPSNPNYPIFRSVPTPKTYKLSSEARFIIKISNSVYVTLPPAVAGVQVVETGLEVT